MRMIHQGQGFHVARHEDERYEVGARYSTWHVRVVGEGPNGEPVFDRVGDEVGMRWWPANLESQGPVRVVTGAKASGGVSGTRQLDGWAPIYPIVALGSSLSRPQDPSGAMGALGKKGAKGPNGPAGAGAPGDGKEDDGKEDDGPGPTKSGAVWDPNTATWRVKAPRKTKIIDIMIGGVRPGGFSTFSRTAGERRLFGPRSGGFSRFYQPHARGVKGKKGAKKPAGAAGAAGVGGELGAMGPGRGEGSGFPSYVSALPVLDSNGTADSRFQVVAHTIPAEDSQIPSGASLAAVAGTDEYSQQNRVLWTERNIIVPAHDGPADMGTQFIDLGPAGAMAKGNPPGVGGRGAMTQSMFRVVRLPPSIKGMANTEGNAIAWNLHASEQGGYAGYGACWGVAQTGAPGSDPVHKTNRKPTTPAARPDALRVMQSDSFKGAQARAQAAGGHFDALAAVLRWLGLGAAASGVQSIGGALKRDETRRQTRGAGGGQHIVAFGSADAGGPFSVGYPKDRHNLGKDKDGHPINPLHFTTLAPFERNQREDGPLDFSTLPYPGGGMYPELSSVFLSWSEKAKMWKWWTTVPYVEDGGNGTPTREPEDPEPPPTTPLEPGDPGDGPGGGPGDFGGLDGEPNGSAGGDFGGLGGNGVPSRGDNSGGKFPIPYAFPGLGGANGLGFSSKVGARSQGTKSPDAMTTYAGNTAFASILFRPASMAPDALDTRFVKFHDPATKAIQQSSIPAVMRVEAFAAQPQREFTYTVKPGTGGARISQGTAAGGLVFMPPEFDMYDYVRGATPSSSVTSSEAYAVFAPGTAAAFGYPDTAKGTVRDCGYRITYDAANSELDFDGKSGGSWSNVMKLSKSAATMAAANVSGALAHTGSTLGFYGNTVTTRQTVTGARNNTEQALKALLSALDTLGLITDSTTAT